MSSYWYLFLVALIPFTYPTAEIDNAEFTLEAAITEEEKQIGLMNRTYLPERKGMIFIYDDEDERSFWMKNTEIPLDIIFLDSDRKVINIEEANPQPNASKNELESYNSERPAQYVLEINQGLSEEKELKKGDEIELDYSIRIVRPFSPINTSSSRE